LMLGNHTLSLSGSTIQPSGIASKIEIGVHLLRTNSIVYPSSINGLSIFGTHTLTSGSAFILPSSIISTLQIGSHLVQTVGSRILPSSITSGVVLGQHILFTPNVSVLPASIDSKINLGQHILRQGAAFILPGGINSEVTFGTVTLTGRTIVEISGQASQARFGSHILIPGLNYIVPIGISSENRFGTISLTTRAIIIPESIDATGLKAISSFPYFDYDPNYGKPNWIYVNTSDPGIDSYFPLKEPPALGNHRVYSQTNIIPQSINSESILGSHTISSITNIYPDSINDGGILGNHILIPEAIRITPNSLVDTAIGNVTIYTVHKVLPEAIKSGLYVSNSTADRPFIFASTRITPISITTRVRMGRHKILMLTTPGQIRSWYEYVSTMESEIQETYTIESIILEQATIDVD